jgi:hypothetical protein
VGWSRVRLNQEVSKYLNSGDTNNEVDDIICRLAVLLLHRDGREGFQLFQLGWLLRPFELLPFELWFGPELLRSRCRDLRCSRCRDLLRSRSGLLRSQVLLPAQVLQAEVLQAQVLQSEVLQDPLPQPRLLRLVEWLLRSRADLRRSDVCRSGCLRSDVRCSRGFLLPLIPS